MLTGDMTRFVKYLKELWFTYSKKIGKIYKEYQKYFIWYENKLKNYWPKSLQKELDKINIKKLEDKFKKINSWKYNNDIKDIISKITKLKAKQEVLNKLIKKSIQ